MSEPEENKLTMPSDINTNNIYVGYLWMSDQSQPIVIDSDKPLKNFEYKTSRNITYTFNPEKERLENYINPLTSKNPFIIEGNLYCKLEKESISIKFASSIYILKRLIIKDTDRQIFSANRMEEINGLLFKQCWKPTKDEYCDLDENKKMQVLQPAEFAFVGFNK